MSHVDEGLIHAYIDGAFPPGNEQGEEIEAHVALCVDCRVRLEKARELKERAQIVMHRLAPENIVTPPFEEVLARRERSQSGSAAPAVPMKPAAKPANRRRTDIFPIPFAWAATVILAVGAGWMGRELVLNQRLADAEQAAVMEADAAPLERNAVSPARAEGSDVQAITPAPTAAAPGTAGPPDAEQLRPTAREAATGFAPDVALRKATDSTLQLAGAAEARMDSAPIVLRGIEAVGAPAAPQARALLGAAARVVAAAPDSANRVLAAGPVLLAYARASAESRWTPEPYAAAGLIGYEPIARLEGTEPVRSERAAVDSLELLRTVYVIDGDTVEVVQELEQTQIALNAIVVTGIDSAAMRRDTSAAGERIRTLNIPPPVIADDRREARFEAGRMTDMLDTAAVFASKSVVTLRREDRTVLLVGRVPEERLQALAARIR